MALAEHFTFLGKEALLAARDVYALRDAAQTILLVFQLGILQQEESLDKFHEQVAHLHYTTQLEIAHPGSHLQDVHKELDCILK